MRQIVATTAIILALATSGCAAPLHGRAGQVPLRQISSAQKPPTPAKRVGFSVQVGAFKAVQNAQRLADTLISRNLDAFWFKKDDGLFAVRFGSYDSERIAENEAKRLKVAGVIAAFFVAPPGSVAIAAKASPAQATHKNIKHDETLGETAARTAERFVGIPYRWGGNNVVEGLDCSGFVRAVYSLCGVQIPRTSAEQYKNGTSVERDQLRDGDLVFFGKGGTVTHVGMYTGKGKFVQAPRRNEPIQITPLDDPKYAAKYMGARRFF